MNQNFNRTPIMAAAAAAAMLSGLGLSADIIPRPSRNTRRSFSKGRRAPTSMQRLTPARGAGSINAEADMQRLIRDGKREEAAALFELHHRIRGATPMRWGRAWYELYKAGDERAA